MEERRRPNVPTRLDSWKAIANYLGRSVRTVRRWETLEGLPVRRHRHEKGTSVYAYCHELDAWRAKLHEVPPGATEPEKKESTQVMPAARRLGWFVGLGVASAILGGFFGWTIRDYGMQPQVKADMRLALVAAVADDTDVTDFQRLNAILEREIDNSRHLRNLSSDQKSAALQRMRRDLDAPLSGDLAVEIGQREGSVSAILIPAAQKIGNRYLVSIEIVDPVNNVRIGGRSIEIIEFDDLLPRFRNLSAEVLEIFAQYPHRRAAASLPLVTTNSLAALQLYANAESLLIDNNPQAGMPLVSLALEHDSNFASARILQAWILKLTNAPRDEYIAVAELARNDAAHLTAEERCFIEGSYKHFLGDREGAESDYLALLKLDPRHMLGAYALLRACQEDDPSSNCSSQRELVENLRLQHRSPFSRHLATIA